jgi:hypothetical protein
MLLVIILLGTITVMTSALVGARRHSPIVARNASDALEAKVAARTASDLTEAILQSEHVLNAEQLAAIVTNLEEAGVTVSVTATDLDGNAPSGNAQPLILTTSSSVGSQTYTLEKIADYDPDAGNPPDMTGFDWRFGEFALYATEQIVLSGRAGVSKWPGRTENGRLIIGTSNEDASSIVIEEEAKLKNGFVAVPEAASDDTVANSTGEDLNVKQMPDELPLRPSDQPDASDVVITGYDTYTYRYNNFNCNQNFRVGQLLLYDGCVLHVEGDRTIVLERGLGIASSTLRVEGNLTLIAHDIIMANDAAIEVADGGSLTIYVVDDIFLQGSTIGFTREYLQKNPNYVDDPPDYDDAEPIQIFTLEASQADKLGLNPGDDDGGGFEIEVNYNGALRGKVHAPQHAISFYDDAVLCGAVMGERILVDDDACVYYDPALAFEYGWTNTDSPVYEDGETQLLAALPEAVAANDIASAIQVVADANPVTPVAPITDSVPAVLERDAEKCQTYGSPSGAIHFENTVADAGGG